MANNWVAETYARNARFVADLAGEVVALLDPKPGERVLDLGCGDGALTERLAGLGCQVVGVDISESLLAAARSRGLDIRHADVRDLPFEHEFDAVFSNAVLHWVTEPERAARSIHRALKPGGRFIAEFGGHGNIAAIVTALRAAARIHDGDDRLAFPWFYPTPEEYRAILAEAGFVVGEIALHPRPTLLPTGIEGWLETFRQPFFDSFGPRKAEVLATVVDLLRPSLCNKTGRWTADYVRLRVSARV